MWALRELIRALETYFFCKWTIFFLDIKEWRRTPNILNSHFCHIAQTCLAVFVDIWWLQMICSPGKECCFQAAFIINPCLPITRHTAATPCIQARTHGQDDLEHQSGQERWFKWFWTSFSTGIFQHTTISRATREWSEKARGGACTSKVYLMKWRVIGSRVKNEEELSYKVLDLTCGSTRQEMRKKP